MKINKFIIPMFVSILSLTSCGLGDVVTKEEFASKIEVLNNISYSAVTVKGTLFTRYVETEAKIDFEFSYVLENGVYVPASEEENDIQTFLNDTLEVNIDSDFLRSELSNDAAYYLKGDNGYAMTFSLGNSDINVSKEYANYTYEYNSNGFYTHTNERETYISNGLTYTSVLDTTYNWRV
jgi:hypothetical protein